MDRPVLKNDIRLYEWYNPENSIVFHITRVISDQGSTFITYEATIPGSGSGTGVLYELFPVNAFSLSRDEEGKLYHPKNSSVSFQAYQRIQREIVNVHEILSNAKSSNSDMQYVVPGSVLYSRDSSEDSEDGFKAVYLWAPSPKVITFEEMCNDFREHASENPEKKIITILNVITSLLKAVKVLHSQCILHRDIKPVNFGCVRIGDDFVSQAVTLFDISSICRFEDVGTDIVGTEGYLEPELVKELNLRKNNSSLFLTEQNYQSDLYSVGATLFHALIVSDEAAEHQYLYDESMFDNLGRLVRQSRLISASGHGGDEELIDALTTLLKRSLCKREFRYSSSEEFITDIEDALFFLGPRLSKLNDQRWIRNKEKQILIPEQDKPIDLIGCAKKVRNYFEKDRRLRMSAGVSDTAVKSFVWEGVYPEGDKYPIWTSAVFEFANRFDLHASDGYIEIQFGEVQNLQSVSIEIQDHVHYSEGTGIEAFDIYGLKAGKVLRIQEEDLPPYIRENIKKVCVVLHQTDLEDPSKPFHLEVEHILLRRNAS